MQVTRRYPILWRHCDINTARKNCKHICLYTAYILGQKRNAAYKTYFVYGKNSKWVWSGNTTITNCRQPSGSLSPIARKRFVTFWALNLKLWVPRVVLAIIATGWNWFSSLNLRFYWSWCRVIRRWRHECARSDIVPNCKKRFPICSIVLAWHRNCWTINDGIMLACNILIAFWRTTCVRCGIVN